jgi:dTDP-4-dehydrorhamnose 3,5-epimerase-like enzyme
MRDIEMLDPAALAGSNRWTVHLTDVAGFERRPILNLHVVNCRPGEVRGNHLHRQQEEYVCVVADRMLCVFTWTDRERREIVIEGPRVFRIPPGIAHAWKNVGASTGYLILYSDKADRLADTEPAMLIE